MRETQEKEREIQGSETYRDARDRSKTDSEAREIEECVVTLV